jgi:hypothetical protein
MSYDKISGHSRHNESSLVYCVQVNRGLLSNKHLGNVLSCRCCGLHIHVGRGYMGGMMERHCIAHNKDSVALGYLIKVF